MALAPDRPGMESAQAGAVSASWRGLLYLAAIVLFLLATVAQLPLLLPAASVLALLSILVSLPACGPVARMLALLFLGGGYLMLWRAGTPWPDYLLAHGGMLYLMALFAVLPVLSIPVQLGHYSRSIEAVLRARIAGLFQLHCIVTVLAFLCGSFMSLAAVPIMMTSMSPVLGSYPLRDPVRFAAVSTVFGYVLPILWTPVSGVVGVVLYSLKLEWTALLPLLMGMSIVGLLLNWGLFWLLELRGRRAQPMPAAVPVADMPGAAPALRHLAQLLLAIVLMVTAIGVLDRLLRIGMLAVVTWLRSRFRWRGAWRWAAAASLPVQPGCR